MEVNPELGPPARLTRQSGRGLELSRRSRQASSVSSMMRLAAFGVLEHRIDLEHVELVEQLLRRGAVAQPREILGRRDQLQFRCLRPYGPAPSARRSNRSDGPGRSATSRPCRRPCVTVSKNLSGWPMPAKARKRRLANLSAPRVLVHASKIGRPARAACLTTRLACLVLAHAHDAGRKAHLVDQPRHATARPAAHGRCRCRSARRPRPARSPCGSARSGSRRP